ncbi:hypothetical protein [Stenotrophomonas maltophilia]|uniref:hypothetical protein n=1 Tax=Stenotrophomonas maltophilia TaxID=40324 RepID=UPI0039F66DBC
MTPFRLATVALLLILGGCGDAGSGVGQSHAPPATPLGPSAPVSRTAHFLIHSAATPERTATVAAAVEALHQSYVATVGQPGSAGPFQLVLYRDQADFKAHNRSSPWAEAYYRRPYAFAYPGQGDAPHHWMLHEVTHQLLAEASGLAPRRWMNEGMACYFGASRLAGGTLHAGVPDPAGYPVWWLGDLQFDSAGRPRLDDAPLPSLQQLVEDSGPPVAGHVNGYYVAWWSLVHFLMEGDARAHRQQTLELLRGGADPVAFRQRIGRYADIEPRWHQHLRALATAQGEAERR